MAVINFTVIDNGEEVLMMRVGNYFVSITVYNICMTVGIRKLANLKIERIQSYRLVALNLSLKIQSMKFPMF